MPAVETIYFKSCEDVDKFFREGREAFNDIYVKKLATMSAFFSRIPSQPWVLNSGTSARGFRLGRQWYDPTQPWNMKKSDRCEQNSCDSKPETILRSGTESYAYFLGRKELQTEWFCVEDLLHRLMPAEEVMAMEESNALITKHVNEEFLRQNYIGGAGHKWIAFSNEASVYCGEFEEDGWFMPALEDPQIGYDTRYVYVKVDPTELATIALLSLDVLDDILVDLNDEDDAYRLDMMEEMGMPLLDIIIPDPRTARRLWYQSKQDRGNWDSTAGFNDRQTLTRLGIDRIIGDYAFSYDRDSLRYNVDTAYNTTLVNGDGYAYDPDDRDTWPRLIRVPRYIPTQIELGCHYIVNRAYRNADFAISLPIVEKAMVKHYMPSGNLGYGELQMAQQDYSGNFQMRRPIWECNPKGKNAYFDAEFQFSAEVKDPTIMHAMLHRLEKGRQTQGACCPLNDYLAPEAPDCYTCTGVGEVE